MNVRRGCSLYGCHSPGGAAVALDSGFRRNGEGLGAMNGAPTKSYRCQGPARILSPKTLGLTHHWGRWPRRTARTPALTCSEVRRMASSVWVAEGERQDLR